MSALTHPAVGLDEPIRPTALRIDLRALCSNLDLCRRHLAAAHGQQAPAILAVVKANAYGHGALPVARALEAKGVEWFGVALVEEGIALRQGGIRAPILVLGGAYEGGWEAMRAFDLCPVVFTEAHLEAARCHGPLAVHVKVDTGMGRIGVLPEALPAFLRRAKRSAGVRVEGLLTHFANADLADDSVTRAQIAAFEAALAEARAAGLEPRWIHLANSAAVLRMTRHLGSHTLVRPGLMLYGYPPSPELRNLGLEPVATWVTKIIHLKEVPKGFRVSYGQTWEAPRRSRIATLPVGYADGYFRAFGNRAEVLVRGRRCPVVGRVCMDMCMVDVTSLPEVAVGEEVVLLGRQGEEEVSADELAGHAGTISYEILCAIGDRVPRLVVAGAD
ncbi:MAG: alanine racemase [Deltaproteobacteria bacterium]|nr:MAG: alanine racemase [Deltaproteobacteria bacterium]